MKNCYQEKQRNAGRPICLGLFIISFSAAIYGIIDALTSASITRTIILFGAALFYLAIAMLMAMNYLEISRKYELSPDGITLVYPFHYTTKYSWEEIGEVAICHMHFSTRSRDAQYQTFIRIVVGEEKNGPSKGYGVWADSLYSTTHFLQVINIVFTEEHHAEFQSTCPFEIKDYRNMKRY